MILSTSFNYRFFNFLNLKKKIIIKFIKILNFGMILINELTFYFIFLL